MLGAKQGEEEEEEEEEEVEELASLSKPHFYLKVVMCPTSTVCPSPAEPASGTCS